MITLIPSERTTEVDDLNFAAGHPDSLWNPLYRAGNVVSSDLEVLTQSNLAPTIAQLIQQHAAGLTRPTSSDALDIFVTKDPLDLQTARIRVRDAVSALTEKIRISSIPPVVPVAIPT